MISEPHIMHWGVAADIGVTKRAAAAPGLNSGLGGEGRRKRRHRGLPARLPTSLVVEAATIASPGWEWLCR